MRECDRRRIVFAVFAMRNTRDAGSGSAREQAAIYRALKLASNCTCAHFVVSISMDEG